MLNAFQRKLDAMSMDPEDPLANRLRERYGKPLPAGVAGDMKAFITLLPRILRRVFALYARLPDKSAAKDVCVHFLAYMYQPEDFIPENAQNGLLGYLDDAYLAAIFYEHMVEEIRHSGNMSLPREDGELLRRVIGLQRKAKVVIPDEAIKIKQMLGELFDGEKTAYHKLFESCKIE